MSSLFFLHQCEQALVSPRSPPMAARSAPQSWGSRKETDRRLPVECDPPPSQEALTSLSRPNPANIRV